MLNGHLWIILFIKVPCSFPTQILIKLITTFNAQPCIEGWKSNDFNNSSYFHRSNFHNKCKQEYVTPSKGKEIWHIEEAWDLVRSTSLKFSMLIARRAKWWSYNTKVGTKNHTWDEIKDIRHGMMCNSIMLWFSWEWGGWPCEEKRDHLERGPNVCMKTWITHKEGFIKFQFGAISHPQYFQLEWHEAWIHIGHASTTEMFGSILI